jgi:hypothetical protein
MGVNGGSGHGGGRTFFALDFPLMDTLALKDAILDAGLGFGGALGAGFAALGGEGAPPLFFFPREKPNFFFLP